MAFLRCDANYVPYQPELLQKPNDYAIDIDFVWEQSMKCTSWKLVMIVVPPVAERQ